MRARTHVLSGIGLAGALLFTLLTENDASACGGCFNPPEKPTVVTDHRMIFSVSKTQATLYDQIKYTGDPGSFAWVLPISGTVTVGLSADILFTGLDGQTQTILQPPPLNCPSPPSNCFQNAGTSAGGSSSSGSGGVTVIKKEVVGPYETVQLKPDAQNPKALETWLTQNGFNVPADVVPVINQYQAESFNFLALRLTPGKGVQDMRPVRVSTQGASIALPLRMVAAGTGPTVGVTLWVVGEGRYEPQNFPSFTIATDEIIWDWGQRKSNYTELRAQKTLAGNGKIWEVESSIILYRQQLESIVKQGSYNGSSSGTVPQTDEERAAQDYLPVTDPQTQQVLKTAAQVRDEDITTLFYGIGTATSRVTRLRADLAHAALNTDLVMQASANQAELPTVRQITKELGQPNCPTFNGCDQTGTAPRDQVAPAGGNAGGSTFTCATGSRSDTAWMGLGLGFLGIAVAHAIRRRRK